MPHRSRNNIKVSQKFSQIIIPPKSIEEFEAEENKKNKIIEIIINLKEGEDITKITKKTLSENLLFTKEVAETPYIIHSPIEVGDDSVILKRDINCVLTVNQFGNLQLFNSDLDLYSVGTELPEVIKEIKRQFIFLYKTAYEWIEKDQVKGKILNKYIDVSKFL
ncbi:MAG: hypothetical protein U0V75_12215 [Ferruginibacter sp.]